MFTKRTVNTRCTCTCQITSTLEMAVKICSYKRGSWHLTCTFILLYNGLMVLLKQWLDQLKKSIGTLIILLQRKELLNLIHVNSANVCVTSCLLKSFHDILQWVVGEKNTVVLNSTKIYALKSLIFNTYLPYFIYSCTASIKVRFTCLLEGNGLKVKHEFILDYLIVYRHIFRKRNCND